jgi:hypothetical protein
MLNGFPFYFPDSSDYLIFTPRLHRSPFYGIFLYIFHLHTFVWLPVVAQALILSHLIWLLVKLRCRTSQEIIFLVTILALALATSLPIVVGFLLPDVFTSAMILAVFILGMHFAELSRIERVYIFLLACVAISSHLSHIVIALGTAGGVLLAAAAIGVRGRELAFRAVLTTAPAGLAIVVTLLNNALVHKTYALSPAGQSFLLANMIEHGPARRYLEESCPEAGYRMCAYLDKMPSTANGLLWELYPNLGGFKAMAQEAQAIVDATIMSRPWDVLRMSLNNIVAAFSTRAPGREVVPVTYSKLAAELLDRKFGHGARVAFESSLQQKGAFPRDLFRAIDSIVFPLAVLALLAIAMVAAVFRIAEVLAFVAAIAIGFVVNTAFCAAASGVHERYQSRVTWLLVFVVILSMAELWQKYPAGRCHGQNALGID